MRRLRLVGSLIDRALALFLLGDYDNPRLLMIPPALLRSSLRTYKRASRLGSMFPTMVETSDGGRVSSLRKKTRRSDPPTLYQDFEASRRAAMSVASLLSTSLSFVSSSGVGNSGVCQITREKSRLNNRAPCSPPWLSKLPNTRQSSHSGIRLSLCWLEG